MIHVCATCGTSYESGAAPPAHCAICTDERQYVPRSGQIWTYREQIAAQHDNRWREHRPGLLSIETTPRFAIGQRAFLLTTPAGNILWDCIANLDSATIRLVTALGGLHAIAVSHPHYYTTMQDWSAAFGAPIRARRVAALRLMRGRLGGDDAVDVDRVLRPHAEEGAVLPDDAADDDMMDPADLDHRSRPAGGLGGGEQAARRHVVDHHVGPFRSRPHARAHQHLDAGFALFHRAGRSGAEKRSDIIAALPRKC